MKKLTEGAEGEIFREGKSIIKKFSSKEVFDREREVLNFSHPFIIKPISVDPKKLTIQYPFFEKGVLKPEKNVFRTMKLLFQLSDCAAYIDSKGFYYSDYSPNNVLQTNDGDFILIDFGSMEKVEKAKKVSAPKQYIEAAKKILSEKFSESFLFLPSLFLTFTALYSYSAKFGPKTHPLLKKMYNWVIDKKPSILGLRNYIFNCFEEPKNFLTHESLYLIQKINGGFPEKILDEIPKNIIDDYRKNYSYR